VGGVKPAEGTIELSDVEGSATPGIKKVHVDLQEEGTDDKGVEE